MHVQVDPAQVRAFSAQSGKQRQVSGALLESQACLKFVRRAYRRWLQLQVDWGGTRSWGSRAGKHCPVCSAHLSTAALKPALVSRVLGRSGESSKSGHEMLGQSEKQTLHAAAGGVKDVQAP